MILFDEELNGLVGLMGSGPDFFISMKKIRLYLLLKYLLKPDWGG